MYLPTPLTLITLFYRSLRESEKSLASVRAEKEDLSRDLCEAQEKLKLQSRELKDALAQRKLAMSEYTEVTDKLSELRQQKQKLSRQVGTLLQPDLISCQVIINFPFPSKIKKIFFVIV